MFGENEELKEKIQEHIEEIKSICIGADSPDAMLNGLLHPNDELDKCREDISKISDLIEQIESLLEEVE